MELSAREAKARFSELRIKWHRRVTSGARKGPAQPAELANAWEKPGSRLLDLTPAVCVAELDPPFDHSDPFDGLLLSHAQQAGYRLLTRDEKMKGHPLAMTA